VILGNLFLAFESLMSLTTQGLVKNHKICHTPNSAVVARGYYGEVGLATAWRRRFSGLPNTGPGPCFKWY